MNSALLSAPSCFRGVLQSLVLGALAFLCYTTGDAFSKGLACRGMAYSQIISLSGLSAFITLFLMSLRAGDKRDFLPRKKRNFLILGLTGVISSIVNLTCFALLPMVTVYAAFFTAPLFISLYGFFVLKEPTNSKRATFLVLSFIGAMIAINPLEVELDRAAHWGWLLLPLCPLLYSVSFILIRTLREIETPSFIAAASPFTRGVVFLPFALYRWENLSWLPSLSAIVMGVFFAFGNWALVKALGRTPITIISPLHYTQLLWGGLVGYFVWDNAPSWNLYLGGSMIVVTGLANAYLLHKEEQEKISLAQAAILETKNLF